MCSPWLNSATACPWSCMPRHPAARMSETRAALTYCRSPMVIVCSPSPSRCLPAIAGVGIAPALGILIFRLPCQSARLGALSIRQTGHVRPNPHCLLLFLSYLAGLPPPAGGRAARLAFGTVGGIRGLDVDVLA